MGRPPYPHTISWVDVPRGLNSLRLDLVVIKTHYFSSIGRSRCGSPKAIEDEEIVSKDLEKKDEDKTSIELEQDDDDPNGDNEEERTELRNYEKDKRSKRKRSVARLRERKFSTLSIAKKKTVVVTAAPAIVLGRRSLLAYLGRGFL